MSYFKYSFIAIFTIVIIFSVLFVKYYHNEQKKYKISLNNSFKQYNNFSLSRYEVSTDNIVRPVNFWHTADAITLSLLKHQPNLKIIDIFINTQVSGVYRLNYYNSKSIQKMKKAIDDYTNLSDDEKAIRLNSVIHRNKNFHNMMKYNNVIMYDYYKEIGVGFEIFNYNKELYRDRFVVKEVVNFPYIKGKYRIIVHSNNKYSVFFEHNGVQMKEYSKKRDKLTTMALYQEITFKNLKNINDGLFYNFLEIENIL